MSAMYDESTHADSTASVADAFRRRVADWAAGGEEGRELDRQIARRHDAQGRLDSARELVDLAAKLRPAS